MSSPQTQLTRIALLVLLGTLDSPLHRELCSTKGVNKEKMEVMHVSNSGFETLNSMASIQRKNEVVATWGRLL
jgi:hypothetical protein